MKIYSYQDIVSEEILFTPASLLDILSQIEELDEFDLSISESLDGNLQLQVGDSFYSLKPSTETEIEVDETDIMEVSDINEETYKQLVEDNTATYQENIESGIVKEALKTLAIGGMVRLAAKLLKK